MLRPAWRQVTSSALFFNMNYQWEHYLDDAPGISEFGSGGSGQQPKNLRADYGNSDLDYRRRFATSFEFRAEGFNISNTPSFNTPSARLPAPLATGYSAAPVETQSNVTNLAANPTKYAWITSATFNYAPRHWLFALR